MEIVEIRRRLLALAGLENEEENEKWQLLCEKAKEEVLRQKKPDVPEEDPRLLWLAVSLAFRDGCIFETSQEGSFQLGDCSYSSGDQAMEWAQSLAADAYQKAAPLLCAPEPFLLKGV